MDYEQMYYELVEDMTALLGQILGEVVFDDYILELQVEEMYNKLVNML